MTPVRLARSSMRAGTQESESKGRPRARERYVLLCASLAAVLVAYLLGGHSGSGSGKILFYASLGGAILSLGIGCLLTVRAFVECGLAVFGRPLMWVAWLLMLPAAAFCAITILALALNFILS